jgi:hypothetical protein
MLMVIIGGAILVGSLQFNEIPIRVEGEGFFTVTRLIFLLGGAITVFFGLFMFSLPGKMKIGRNRFVIYKRNPAKCASVCRLLKASFRNAFRSMKRSSS